MRRHLSPETAMKLSLHALARLASFGVLTLLALAALSISWGLHALD
jgi:hypothetical protein